MTKIYETEKSGLYINVFVFMNKNIFLIENDTDLSIKSNRGIGIM
jgi:hypothetical protein